MISMRAVAWVGLLLGLAVVTAMGLLTLGREEDVPGLVNKKAVNYSDEISVPEALIAPIQESFSKEINGSRETPESTGDSGSSPASDEQETETLEELERIFEKKYEGKDRFVLKGYYDVACLERLALARPLLEEKMEQGLFEEYAPVGEEGFNVTAHVPNMTENPMVMNVMIPLGDGRTVPRVVRLEPDETPEIFRAHAEAKWLKDRLREMTRKERAERDR